VRLLLVRHGESICGVNGIVGGARGCTGLTERGFAQARALRDRLVEEGLTPDVVLSSTLPRASNTADTVAEALDLEVIRDDDLCEMVPGEIDGSTWDEWRAQHGFDPSAEPDRPLSPGGESITTFLARVRATLERLRGEHDGRAVLAFCHGGIVFGSLTALMGADPRQASAQSDFTSITEWRHENDRWHLVRFNDVAHLVGTDLLPPATVNV
jgi:probable phosphoglycerate mutase